MANRYEEMIQNEWEKFSDKNKMLPNIMLLGATGCGKSSLINLVFQKRLAPVNDNSRGTEGFETYWGKDHDMGVNLIDSRGYEMENGKGESFLEYSKSIRKKLKENHEKEPLAKIHIIWYCISVAGKKIQDYDIEILKLLRKEDELKHRVAVVLTKCDEDDEEGNIAKEYKRILAEEVGEDLPAFEVSTDLNLELDLKKMITWSAEQLDDTDLKEAFIGSQMISLKEKKETAAAKIGFYSLVAAGIGLTPIPMSDAVLLTPLQVTMSTHIIYIYGMENYADIPKALIGNIVVSNLGKAFAGGLLKLIPGIGTFAGGCINAGVASLITSAIGFAISELCYEGCKKIVEGEYQDMTSVIDVGMIQKYVQEYMKDHKASKEIGVNKEAQEYAKKYIKEYKASEK